MKKLDKGIDVLCVFTDGSPPVPRKFKIKYSDGTYRTVNVDDVGLIESIAPMGNHNYIYHCRSEVDNLLIEYELKYIVNDMRWILFRV